MAKFQVELSDDLYTRISNRIGKYHKSLFAELALNVALNNLDIMSNIPDKAKKHSNITQQAGNQVGGLKGNCDKTSQTYSIDDDFA